MAKMNIKVTPENLGGAIDEIARLYLSETNDKIAVASERAARDLVRRTKSTAPSRRGRFKNAIDYRESPRSTALSRIFVWYVKAPHYRLTHLLVHGHAKKNGGRTKANPFLVNALDQVLPSYERDIKEALSND